MTAVTTSTFDITGDYTLDPNHTRLSFVARHAMVTRVRGHFAQFTGSAHLDASDPTRSSAQVTIEAASVDTGNAQRDGHLRSNDFFDMETHPQITFASTGVEVVDPTHYRLLGDLTIRGVTRPVTVEFELTGQSVDPYGNQRVGFEGAATINRKDWGVSWNAPLETGGVLVSDKVTLEIDVAAIRQRPAS